MIAIMAATDIPMNDQVVQEYRFEDTNGTENSIDIALLDMRKQLRQDLESIQTVNWKETE